MRTKKTVQEILDRLPDDCTLEDVLYHLYVVHAADRGKLEANDGRTVPHDEAARELRKKWSIGAAR